jgi:hypothetical protein
MRHALTASLFLLFVIGMSFQVWGQSTRGITNPPDVLRPGTTQRPTYGIPPTTTPGGSSTNDGNSGGPLLPPNPSGGTAEPGTNDAAYLNSIPTNTALTNGRIRLFHRTDQGSQFALLTDEATGRSYVILTEGINIVIDGLPDVNGIPVGTIDFAADRAVIWSTSPQLLKELSNNSEAIDVRDFNLEIYLEGNVVFRQNDRVMYLDRLFYNVNEQVGRMVDVDIQIPLKQRGAQIRIIAELARQAGPGLFHAENAFVTSSRLGLPGYRLQSDNITFQDSALAQWDPTTGESPADVFQGESERMLESRNNWLYIRSTPVFYWPWIATDLSSPSFFLRNLHIKNDDMFGTQILTDWDLYQLLGIKDQPDESEWRMSLDYMSKRGLGHGTTFLYSGDEILTLSGEAAGGIDFWGIYDDGNDNLGLERRSLTPEKSYRGRFFWQHRERFDNGLLLSGELGWISDRNFLEQFQEREWDELKDQSTRLELKGIRDNQAWDIELDARINNFTTNTSWLPRADHFWLGQDLLEKRLTWYEHTYVGYGRFGTTDRPEDLADDALFEYLPWELDSGGVSPDSRDGLVFSTHQELDMPLQLGALKVVPYVLGQVDYWGQDATGSDLSRVMGQIGVRSSIPFWKVDPNVRNELFNVNGLAHKMNFDMEFALAEADTPLGAVPMYNALDDNAIEAVRRRNMIATFGGAIPYEFDERSYAFRSGMQSWVTNPASEIADDMCMFRLGMRNRWQTKRGLMGREHIVDWITFDTGITLFPDSMRDNFGQSAGMFDYNFRWHVGDRLAILSDGQFDFFDDGQQLVRIGALLNKSPRGNLYVGLQELNGPFSSSILSASFNYRMSEKWITSLGASYDFADDRNIGQNFSITRIGESFLVRLGMTVDTSRDSYGLQFSIEPRFLSRSIGRVGGMPIPLAGADRLE